MQGFSLLTDMQPCVVWVRTHAPVDGAQHRARVRSKRTQQATPSFCQKFAVKTEKFHQLKRKSYVEQHGRVYTRVTYRCVCVWCKTGVRVVIYLFFFSVRWGNIQPARRFAQREPAGWVALLRQRRGRPWLAVNRLRKTSRRMASKLQKILSSFCWVSRAGVR